MARKASLVATTPSGIPGIDDLRWGSHICQWYSKPADLAATVVPYFEAGIKNNERCIWVTAGSYRAAEARRDLEAVVERLDLTIAAGQLRLIDAGGWYVNGNSLGGAKVVEHWLEEERKALAVGYKGLRIACDTSFVGEGDWQLFVQYENAFNQAMSRKHRIVALCSYNLLDVQPNKMFEAVHSHHVTIHQAGADWRALEL